MDMYSKLLIGPCTYPLNALNLSTGSALTAAHFCQTATKVSKKALPLRTALAALRCPSLRSRSVGTLRRAIHGPIAALPASMPVDPLRRTSTRPPERGGRSRSRSRSKARSKTRSKAGSKAGSQAARALTHTHPSIHHQRGTRYPAACPGQHKNCGMGDVFRLAKSQRVTRQLFTHRGRRFAQGFQ